MKKAATKKTAYSPIGKRVIIRSAMSGVHHGILVSQAGDSVVLADSERLWYWVVARLTGQVSSCSELAAHGMVRAKSKPAARLAWAQILGVCEMLPVSDEAAESFK